MTETDRRHQLERLVDGELCPEDERALLLSLDEATCEWRELALLFLEERALRGDLPSSACEIPPVDEPAHDVSRRAAGLARVGWPASLALTALAAFWIGRGGPVSDVEPSGDRVANATDAVPAKVDSEDQDVSTADPDAPTEIAAADESPEATEYVAMKLIGSDDVDLQEVNVPLYHESQLPQTSTLTERLPYVPNEVRDVLLRRGQTVIETTEFVTLQLVDGRSAIIPITSIEVRPLRPDEIR